MSEPRNWAQEARWALAHAETVDELLTVADRLAARMRAWKENGAPDDQANLIGFVADLRMACVEQAERLAAFASKTVDWDRDGYHERIAESMERKLKVENGGASVTPINRKENGE